MGDFVAKYLLELARRIDRPRPGKIRYILAKLSASLQGADTYVRQAVSTQLLRLKARVKSKKIRKVLSRRARTVLQPA